MKPAIVTAVLLASSSALIAQQTAPQRGFDVVSITPNRSGLPGRINVTPSGRVEWTNTTLAGILGLAYMRFPFDPRQITGGPSWIKTDGFTIIATSETPLQSRPDGLPVDLIAKVRAMVEDRFQVRVHEEQREGDMYALVLARADKKTGPGLHSVPDACGEAMKALVGGTRPVGPPPCSFGGQPWRLIGTGVTMTAFGYVLSANVGRTVVDRTGLTGSFDLELTFDPSSSMRVLPGAASGPQTPDDTRPSIFTALQEQLGLKLESTRGPIDVLVIDQAERPTAN